MNQFHRRVLAAIADGIGNAPEHSVVLSAATILAASGIALLLRVSTICSAVEKEEQHQLINDAQAKLREVKSRLDLLAPDADDATLPLGVLQICTEAQQAARQLAPFARKGPVVHLAVATQLITGAMQASWFELSERLDGVSESESDFVIKQVRSFLGPVSGQVVYEIYQRGGIVDLGQRAAQRLGFPQGHPPGSQRP